MPNVALVEIDAKYSFWQKSLIPSESQYVRSAMRHAAAWAISDNFFYSHFVSVAFAISAVVFSFFNGISYFLQLPIEILLNIVSFKPIQVIVDFYLDLRNGILSFFFVTLGVTFIAAGLIFPGPIFTFFAPEYFDTKEQKLRHLNDNLKKENTTLTISNEDKEKKIGMAADFLEKQKKELDELKGKKTFFRFC